MDWIERKFLLFRSLMLILIPLFLISYEGPNLPAEYIIITNQTLEGAFEPVAEYITRKGIVAEVYTVNEILNSYTCDPVSNIYDSAGAIRGFLMDKYQDGAQWVLLGGDETVVPVRYAAVSPNSYISDSTYPVKMAPSDLYYSDLDGNWNVDGDEYYGEPHDDSIEVEPELYVGRIPCENATDVENWFEKLVSYENPTHLSYFTKFFWAAADQMKIYPYKIISDFPPGTGILNDTSMIENSDGSLPKGSDVINKMNEHFGFFTFFGHGSPDNLTVSAPGYNQPSMDRNFLVSRDYCDVHWVSQGGHCRVETGNGLDCLTNEDYYGVMAIYSCYHAAYDFENFDYDPWNMCYGPSIMEAFILQPDKGGPAYIGFTRQAGYYSNMMLHESLLNRLFNGDNIGIAVAGSRNQFSAYKDISRGYSLFGCPLMRVWTATPSEFNNVSVTDNGTSITVNTGTSGCDICVCSVDGGATYYMVAHNTSNHIFTTSERPVYVTITKPNYIPYKTLAPIDLALQDVTVEMDDTNNYVASNSITAAGNSTYFVIEGNGSDGSNVTMEAGNYISLLPGFEAQEGCFFNAYIDNLGLSDERITEPLAFDYRSDNTTETTSDSTAVELSSKETKESIPKVFSCAQNYPNPFMRNTTIKYGLPKNCDNVNLTIFNLAGQAVKTLVNEQQSAGFKSVRWNGENSAGVQVPQGIYFYVFKADDFEDHRKMVLLK